MGETDKNEKVVFPKLSYEVVGALYEVWNDIGWSHKEKYLEKAVAVAFQRKGIQFIEQYKVDLKFKDKKVGTYYFDFLVEDKIIVELKRREYFSQQDIKQLYAYLQSSELKLGILAHFTRDGVKIKRILNIY